MNKLIKKSISTLLVLSTTFLLFACGIDNTKSTLEKSTASIKLSCENKEEKTVLLKDLTNLPVVEEEIHTKNAINEESTFKVKGFTLKDLCKNNNIDIDSYNTLSVTASDGYVAEFDEDTFKNNELIFAYEKDEDVLDEKSQPLTLVIDNLPSNNFVSAITKISFTNKEDETKNDSEDISVSLSEFSVLVDGLSDGEMNLSSKKLERNLKASSITAKVKENGNIIDSKFYGYRLIHVLEFLRVEDFKEIKITAKDGFTSSITSDELDETVILTADKANEESAETIPLKIAGENLSLKQQISDIASISIVS